MEFISQQLVHYQASEIENKVDHTYYNPTHYVAFSMQLKSPACKGIPLSTQAYSITNLELSLHNKNEDKKTPIQVHLGYHTHYNSSRDCVLLVK